MIVKSEIANEVDGIALLRYNLDVLEIELEGLFRGQL